MNGAKKDIDPASEASARTTKRRRCPSWSWTRRRPARSRPAAPRSRATPSSRRPRPASTACSTRKGEVLYVGKAKNIKKRRHRPTRGRPAYDARIARMIAGDRGAGIRHHRDRDRSAAARSQPDQAAAAALQRAAARRQVVSLHPDHRRTTGRRRSSSIAARARGKGSYYGPFASAGRSTAPSTRLQRAFLLRSCSDSFFESRTRPCLLHQIKRCSAPCTGEIDFAGYSELVREANAFLSGSSQVGAGGAGGRDGEGVGGARFRARRDLPRPACGAVGDPVAPGHQSAQRSRRPTCSPCIRTAATPASRCSSSAPGRTGATAPISRRPTARSAPGEVLGAFLAQFYDDKPPPRLHSASRTISRSASCWPRRFAPRAGRKVEVSVPQRGERKELVDARAGQCARGAGAQARRYLVAAEAARRR